MRTHTKPIRYHFIILILLIVLNCREDSICQNRNDLESKITENEIEGRKIPDYTFTRVKNYKKHGETEKVSIEELRGKWIILYFWTKNCTPCINSFPKLNEIQNKHSTNAQVVLVGIKDMWNKSIEPYFDGVRNAQKINLPIAYDSGLVKKLTILYASTVVVIDPEGVIKSVFLSDDTLSKRIKNLIRRRKGKKGD